MYIKTIHTYSNSHIQTSIMASRFTKPITIPKITGRTRVEYLLYSNKYDLLLKKSIRSIINRNGINLYTISCICGDFYCTKNSYHEACFEFEIHVRSCGE